MTGTPSARDIYECPRDGEVFLHLRHAGRTVVCPVCGYAGNFIVHTYAEFETPEAGEAVSRPADYSEVKAPKSLSDLLFETHGLKAEVDREPERGVRPDGSFTLNVKAGAKEGWIRAVLEDGPSRVRVKVSDPSVQPPEFRSLDEAERWLVAWLRG